ncbi:hypothetical protein [Bacillus sp. FJAT-27251]|uniref:hypothetical protein n=1 Tax=Bacillus sp. FJAT-27251 TaxID=1684142 RepID=UPI0006A777F8|nr:hypothetical protein [Bacillus sp. FJAT-27251]
MRYEQVQFSDELKQRIEHTERALQSYIDALLSEYKQAFADLELEFEAGLEREGTDPFQPGYNSSVSIGIIDIDGEVPYIHFINIWQCERTFLGLPISMNIPGSKVTGEMLDETIEEIKEELKEFLEEVLADERESRA